MFGSGGVGKTSLILRFVNNYFEDNLQKTIGTNFLMKNVELEGNSIRLLIWDIGGQAQFHKLRSVYFKGSSGALGVFALDNLPSLLKLPGWVSSIKKSVKKSIPMIFLGNKSDLGRKVDRAEAEDLAKRLGGEYMETSAKTGDNVMLAFEKIAKACLEDILIE